MNRGGVSTNQPLALSFKPQGLYLQSCVICARCFVFDSKGNTPYDHKQHYYHSVLGYEDRLYIEVSSKRYLQPDIEWCTRTTLTQTKPTNNYETDTHSSLLSAP